MKHNLLPDYRPDIDGLRAVAVLSVVGYHAFPEALRGGYVGVDVFFVISGFLISSIILRNLEAGAFSFLDFYVRRVKRIFPALALVLGFCLLAGWALLIADEFRQLGKHTAAGAAFVLNFVLIDEAGYFDTRSELKPLLHLWSLGIEEQFYLVWPLLLWLCYRLRRSALVFILVFAAISFALNAGRIGGGHAVQTFFHPLTRFWELLAGAGLAWLSLHRAPGSLAERIARLPGVANAASVLGLLLIAVPVALMDRNRAFPGGWALLPVAGSVLMIAAGMGGAGNRAVLARPWMVRIGLISYPLYLWHWPLLSLARVLDDRAPDTAVRVGLVLLAMLLAEATYRCVERPIRFGSGDDTRPSTGTIALALTVIVAALGGLGFAAHTGALKPRLASFDAVSAAKGDWAYPRADTKLPSLRVSLRTLKGRSDDTLLFVGDSTMEQLYPRVRRLHEQSGQAVSVAFATAGGCPPVPGIDQISGYCRGMMQDVLAYAAEPQVKKIVVGALWDYIGHESYAHEGRSPIPADLGAKLYADYADRLRALIAAGKEVYLVLPTPRGPQMDPLRFIDLSARLSGQPRDLAPLRTADFLAATTGPRRQLEDLARRSGAILIDPVADFCNAETCPNLTPDGRPTCKDDRHFRPFYVEEKVRLFDRLFPSR